MRASTTPLLALIALLALLTASATAAATPAVSGAVLARATDVPGTDPTTETKNLQVWKKKVNGCEAPPVVKNVDTKVFRVVIEQPDAKKIGQIAALMAQEFVELQLALRASCNAFNTFCKNVAKQSLQNASAQDCETALQSCVASIPTSLAIEPILTDDKTGGDSAASTSSAVASATTSTAAAIATPPPTSLGGGGKGKGGKNNGGNAAGGGKKQVDPNAGKKANAGGNKGGNAAGGGKKQVDPNAGKKANAGGNKGGNKNTGANKGGNKGKNTGKNTNTGKNNNNTGKNNGGNAAGNAGKNNTGKNNNTGNAGNAAGNAGKNTGKKQTDPNAGKAAGGAVEPPNTKPTGLRNDAQFCSQVGLGGALHDGTQKKTVTCSTTVQGTIPAFENMVSSIILSPASGATIKASSDVTVAVRTQGMNLGFFEDPNTRYYTSPQTLDKQGNIEGHQHVTVQALGNAQAPPNPQTQALAFFKGLDQATNNGILSVTIPAGTLKPGLTRICTMTGTRGHQAVLMPVARRGAQDDCIRVTVV